MKKMIMMMVAASTLALGARAGTTVEWGLDVDSANFINRYYIPPFNVDYGLSRFYIFVVESDTQYFSLDCANFLSLSAQLQDGTFDGTGPLILDALVFDSYPFGDPENWMEWQSPTFFSDIPEGMNFGLLFLAEFEKPDNVNGWSISLSDPGRVWVEGITFTYAPMALADSSTGHDTGGKNIFFFNTGDIGWYSINNNLAIAIPEPATGLLALAGIALLVRRKRK